MGRSIPDNSCSLVKFFMIKNIVIITPYFAPAWSYGGPPKVLYTLAQEFVKRGKQVDVVTTDVLDHRRNFLLQEKMVGISIYRFRTVSNYLAYKNKIFFVADFLNKTKKILAKADFILFSDLRVILNWQVYNYVYLKGIPYGIYAFGQIPRGNGFKAVAKFFFDLLWVKDFAEKASFRFVQTSHEQKMFHDFFDVPTTDTQLLTLPVELKKQELEIDILNNYRKKWGLEIDDRIMLFVGRLHYLKGLDLLIDAVLPEFKKDHNLKLLIVGRDDGEEKKLRKLIDKELEKQIIFTGPLYERETVYAYKSADCFVLTPRFYEETSLAALEALSFGLPVVVSQESDIPYLKEYQAGYVIENNPQSIRKAIVNILAKMKKDKNLMQMNAIKLISDKYSSSSVVLQLLSIIERN